MTKRLRLFFLTIFFHLLLAGVWLQASDGFAVVELFTSEGCSSCPPADRLLEQIAHRNNVFALSFHVTYWDYLGWEDPFGKEAFDARQRYYTQHLGESTYTPQMIINGETALVGSRQGEVEARLRDALKESSKHILSLSAIQRENMVHIHYKIGGPLSSQMVVNLAVLVRESENKPVRGENRGRVLRHANVVRAFKTLKGSVEGEGALTVPKEGESFFVIAYLQDNDSLKILAAAKTEITM